MEKWQLLIDELDELSLVNVPAQEDADVVAFGKSMRFNIVDFKKGSKRSGRQHHQAMACPDCGDEVDAGKEDCPTCGAYVPIHKQDNDPPIVNTVPLAFGKSYYDSESRRYMAQSGRAMPNGGFPISDAQDLHNAIQAFGRAKNKSATAHHIRSRARALNLHSMLPTEGELAGLTKSHTPANKETAMETEIEKRAKDLENQNIELKKNYDVLKSLINLPYAEQAYAMRLPDIERPAFIAKSSAERAELAKPLYVSKTDGAVFYRTDDPRMVDLAKHVDAQNDKFAKMAEDVEIAKYNDEARTFLKHLGGTLDLKSKLLRTINKNFEGDDRKNLIEMLKANDANLSNAFKMFGSTDASGDVSDGTAAGEFNAAVEKFAKANNLPMGESAEAKFLDTAEGMRLYAEVDAQRKQSRRGN